MITLAKFGGQVEIFLTIQGEGRNIGMPAVFVRTSYCNLHCGYCDAFYTFNFIGTKFPQNFPKVNRLEHQVRMTPEQVYDEVRKFTCKNVVLTGGEPLLQQKQLIPLVQMLREGGYWIEVETNGTLIPEFDFDKYVHQYNCSPKLENSGNPLSLRFVDEALRWFSKQGHRKTWFKFVVATPMDLHEVLELVQGYHLYQVFLMPEGTTKEDTAEKSKWLVEVCKEHSFRFTPRLQIELYGMKPGT